MVEEAAELRRQWSEEGFETARASPWQQERMRLVPETPRAEEVINLAILECCFRQQREATAEALEEAAKGLWCDVSSNPARKHWRQGPLPTLCTSTQIYSYEHERALTSVEGLRMVGWPSAIMLEVSPANLRSLLGESMALPSHAVAVWALFEATWQVLPDACATQQR